MIYTIQFKDFSKSFSVWKTFFDTVLVRAQTSWPHATKITRGINWSFQTQILYLKRF